MKIIKYNRIEYRNSLNQLHRKNKPAVIWDTGTKMWYQNGKLHNLDGPAVVAESGVTLYYINGIEYNSEEYKFISFCQGQLPKLV